MAGENQEHRAVAKFLFWTVFSILIVISIMMVKTKYTDEKEFVQYAAAAEAENNPLLCENIKNLRLSSQCYSSFVQEGYDCIASVQNNSKVNTLAIYQRTIHKMLNISFAQYTTEAHPSDACLIAQGVATKDDLFCDMVFFDNKVPENLECRVSVFIERYSDEGLSDCCHIK